MGRVLGDWSIALIKVITSEFFTGEFNPEDFSPVKINDLRKPLDELPENVLRNFLVELRLAIQTEMLWQEEVGLSVESRLIEIAELYLEAQEYYAQFNEKLRERISGPDYRPVLRLNGRMW